MSVVGPRPALPNEVATYNDYQRQRLLVKPGMTCYWQTRRNRDSITFDEWVDLDLSRGYRYVTHALRAGDDPVVVSEKVVRRIMREEGLSVAYAKRRARYSSYKGEISDAPENLVNRAFRAAAPNELRLADITEFGLPGGKVYLSPILDCFDGGLPAWPIGTSPNAELADSSLEAHAARSARASAP